MCLPRFYRFQDTCWLRLLWTSAMPLKSGLLSALKQLHFWASMSQRLSRPQIPRIRPRQKERWLGLLSYPVRRLSLVFTRNMQAAREDGVTAWFTPYRLLPCPPAPTRRMSRTQWSGCRLWRYGLPPLPKSPSRVNYPLSHLLSNRIGRTD